MTAARALDVGVTHFREGRIAEAMQSFKYALFHKVSLAPSQKLQLHKYAGLTFLSFNDIDEAAEQFYQGLLVDEKQFLADPDFAPAAASPKLTEALEIAKARLREAKKPAPPPPAAKPTDWRTPVGWTCVGVGSASLVTSGVFYLMAWDTHSEWDAEDEDRDRADDLQSQGETQLLVSQIALGAGVVLTGLGIYFVLSADDGGGSSAAEAPRLVLSPVGPGGRAGFLMSGRF
ncbi:hypothetical protein K8I61_06470 [bacterium]|nr:hypothetical protein [bacterium]